MAVERGTSPSGDKGQSAKQDMWSSLLNSVASGRRLPEKNLIVLGKDSFLIYLTVAGGNTETQKEFLESFTKDGSNRRILESQGKRRPPIANEFALGYTYHDVLDADQEDTLARISVFLLAQPISSFASLMKPLLTPESLSNTAVVILLNWLEPWNWLKELKKWIQLLQTLLLSLDDRAKAEMEEIMSEWREKKRGPSSGDSAVVVIDGDVNIPLGPGEWDASLGLPLCVVCQNADKIEVLEKERSWKEEEFDYVLQTLRTLLLKHGASLIYTTPNIPSHLQPLIHSTIGITSTLKKEPLKHNVIDRDKVLVPPNWDSWGKIRVLREGFDVEAVSSGWMNDLAAPKEEENTSDDPFIVRKTESGATSAISTYEEEIKDPGKESQPGAGVQSNGTGIEVESLDSQQFLASQLEILTTLKAQDQATNKDTPTRERDSFRPRRDARSPEKGADMGGRVNDHIGPVQFNMGGIQVDADDMLLKLKEREADRAQARAQSPEHLSTPETKAQNDALNDFFKGLMKRHPGSTVNSPRSQAG